MINSRIEETINQIMTAVIADGSENKLADAEAMFRSAARRLADIRYKMRQTNGRNNIGSLFTNK